MILRDVDWWALDAARFMTAAAGDGPLLRNVFEHLM
jgi:hypothetical protein